MEPLRRSSMCRIQKEREERGAPTLGFFKPFEIKRLFIDPADQVHWTAEERAILQQGGDLFQRAPEQLLEKIPFEFRYDFRCGDIDCSGHSMMCTDWEMMQAYRAWRREYRDQWEDKFRQRFETEMIHKKDTHFFVGTLHQYPKNWIIVGLFYPPKPQTGSLL
jgi:hypothetical protein